MGLLDRLVKPSTRAFVREARRTPGYSLFDLIHGYVYARWPYLYIGIGTGEHPAAPWIERVAGWAAALASLGRPAARHVNGNDFADGYHGKAVPLATAEQLVHIHHDLEVRDLEQVIPYKRARSIILKNPDHIVVLECPCRSAREHPCLPLDVCLIVGEPFASLVREHHPRRSRRITSEEAVAILRAEDLRGHVHHAFFKEAMLDRFYAICNCCKCCCGAMQAQRNGTPMLTSSGYVSVLDPALCIGCGNCEAYCQFEALSLADSLNQVNYEKCMGCGICVSKCEQGALALVLDPAKGLPLEVCSIMSDALRLDELEPAARV
jgi:Pyruvate/2-oxoacid:ferredoxin oxidoreductase delta subunit